MRKTAFHTLQIILFSILYFSVTFPSYAQESHIAISPTLLEIEAARPSTIKKTVNIKNLTTNPINLSIQLLPFTQSTDDNANAQILFDPTQKQETRQFIRESAKIILDGDTIADSISLAPLQEKVVTLSLNISADETITDHYFSLVFIKTPTVTPGEIQSSVSELLPGVASHVILSIGQNKGSGVINEFSTPFFNEKGPVLFNLMVQNNKSKYIKQYGSITIKNMFGQSVGKIDIPASLVLGNTTKKIPHIYWNEGFLLGLYNATLTTNGLGSDTVSRTIYFIGLPLTYIFGWIILVMILAFVLSRVRKKRAI